MKYFIFKLLICFLILFSPTLYAKEKQEIILKGKVLNNLTKKPVDFGTVLILELKIKADTLADGSYTFKIPKPGEYTIIVRSTGLNNIQTKFKIEKSTTRDFYLAPLSIEGQGIIIYGDRDIQKISQANNDCSGNQIRAWHFW